MSGGDAAEVALMAAILAEPRDALAVRQYADRLRDAGREFDAAVAEAMGRAPDKLVESLSYKRLSDMLEAEWQLSVGTVSAGIVAAAAIKAAAVASLSGLYVQTGRLLAAEGDVAECIYATACPHPDGRLTMWLVRDGGDGDDSWLHLGDCKIPSE